MEVTASIYDRGGYKRREKNCAGNSKPLVFRGNDPNLYQKTVVKGIQTFTNGEKIRHAIDGVLGDEFFSKKLSQAGIAITDDKIVLPKDKITDRIIQTVKYPFVDLPRDLLIFVLKPLQQDSSPFKKFANGILDSDPLRKRIKDKEVQSGLSCVREILNDFATPIEKEKYDIDFSTKKLTSTATSNITKIAKNYSSRDERTLNRMTTATVSAVYSSSDFYNISMLQKDNHDEARKAEKARFKQEITRMLLSAGLTFLTLGVIGDKVKKSVVLNSVVIALSALISEIASRLFNKVPLHPLTPEQAEKIATRNALDPPNDAKQTKKPQTETKEQTKTKDGIKFKSSAKNTAFETFADKDGSLASLAALFGNPGEKTQKTAPAAPPQNNKKGLKLKNIVLGAFGAASLVFLLSKKGPFKGGFEAISEGSKKFKEAVTTKKHVINLNELNNKIQTLRSTKEGGEISKVLDEYEKYIAHFKNNENLSEITTRKDRILLPGVYGGLTKLFSTIYQILSAPGRLVNIGIDAIKNKKTKKNPAELLIKTPKDMKKELSELSEILTKEKNTSSQAQAIKKKIRNIELTPETGELASLSRTLVTIIGTYFFVNDYSNKVLIESAGKNTEKAREERNERIAHKVSNFFFNGMLMNLFNSVFKKPLNNSLPQAALIAGATELTNEFLVRKSICQPVGRMKSKQAIMDYEKAQVENKGPVGTWSRFFRKITGKKTLTQKAGIDNK